MRNPEGSLILKFGLVVQVRNLEEVAHPHIWFGGAGAEPRGVAHPHIWLGGAGAEPRGVAHPHIWFGGAVAEPEGLLTLIFGLVVQVRNSKVLLILIFFGGAGAEPQGVAPRLRLLTPCGPGT